MASNWQYQVDQISLDAKAEKFQESLNVRGNEGWELISLIPLPGPGVCLFLAVFKRPSTDSPPQEASIPSTGPYQNEDSPIF